MPIKWSSINIYIALFKILKQNSCNICKQKTKEELHSIFQHYVHVHEYICRKQPIYQQIDLPAVGLNDAGPLWKYIKYPSKTTLICMYFDRSLLVIQTEGHVSNLGFNLEAGIELELVWAMFVYPMYLKSEPISLLVLNNFKCLFPFGQGW